MKRRKKKKKQNTKTRRKKRRDLRALIPFLSTFKEIKPSQRGILLAHLDDSACDILCETVSNVLRNPRIKPTLRKKLCKSLHPYKTLLRQLGDSKKSLKFKRKILYKVGGFPLASILSAAIPFLMSLLRK